MGTPMLRLLADADGIKAAVVAAILARKPMVLTLAAFLDVAEALEGEEAALLWLRRQVNAAGWPIMVNIGKSDGSSDTIVLGPDSWSRDKLRGWASIHLEALGAEFGPVSGMTP